MTNSTLINTTVTQSQLDLINETYYDYNYYDDEAELIYALMELPELSELSYDELDILCNEIDSGDNNCSSYGSIYDSHPDYDYYDYTPDNDLHEEGN